MNIKHTIRIPLFLILALILFPLDAYPDIVGISFSDTLQTVKEKLKNANIQYEYIEKPREYWMKKYENDEKVVDEMLKTKPKGPYIEYDGALNNNPLVGATMIGFGPKNVSEIRTWTFGDKDKTLRILTVLISKYGDSYLYREEKKTRYTEYLIWDIPQPNSANDLEVTLEIDHFYLIKDLIRFVQKKTGKPEGSEMVRDLEEDPKYISTIIYKLKAKAPPDDAGF